MLTYIILPSLLHWRIYSFTRSINLPFFRPSIYSLCQSITHIHCLIQLIFHSSINSFIFFIHSLQYSLIHLFIHSNIHSINLSYIRKLLHSFIQSVKQSHFYSFSDHSLEQYFFIHLYIHSFNHSSNSSSLHSFMHSIIFLQI